MLSYDIDSLIRETPDSAALLFQLWKILRNAAHETELLPEERVALQSWNYDTANGNGICDILVNERYDELASGLTALSYLGSALLYRYVKSINDTFKRFQIDCFDPESIETAFPNCGSLLADLAVAEKPYLEQLWIKGEIVHATRGFIERNVAAFQKRKPPGYDKH